MRVFSGLEVLLADHADLLAGKNIGLIVNPTSVDSEFNLSLDLIAEVPGCRIGALFGPEHGAFGAAQDMEGVEGGEDEYHGIPVYSLYGNSLESLKPSQQQLKGLDLLIFDIQDIGSRYYTYAYTMAFCMEAAAEADLQMFVLDRPNPLSGSLIEGNVGSIDFRSFVGYYPLPVRHGMTLGELARYFNEEFGIGCDLAIVHVENWQRSMWFDQTGLPWVMPSPNMPTLNTAIVYPGGCLIEGTNISEGRGTTRPFEIIGAPYINPYQLTETLNKAGLEGVRFRPIYFKPTFHKYAGEVCGGVFVHVINRNRFRSFMTYLRLIMEVRSLWPEQFKWRTEPYEFDTRNLAFDLLCGTDMIRKFIEAGEDIKTIVDFWSVEIAQFHKVRENYLIYRQL